MAGINGGALRGSLQDDRANGATSRSSPRGREATFDECSLPELLKNIFFRPEKLIPNLF